MKEYLLSVVSAAILSAVLLEIVGRKTVSGGVLQLLTGIFIAVVIIKPLLKLDLEPYLRNGDRLRIQAENLAVSGELQAEEEKKAIITSSLQAYITKKAEDLGATVMPQIELDGLLPCGVRIAGNVSPYVRSSLSAWIEENLGIAKEDQHWIG